MLLVVTDTLTLLVYDQTSLCWSSQLPFLPVAICRANFMVSITLYTIYTLQGFRFSQRLSLILKLDFWALYYFIFSTLLATFQRYFNGLSWLVQYLLQCSQWIERTLKESNEKDQWNRIESLTSNSKEIM